MTTLLRGASAVIGVGALVAVGAGTAVGADPAPTPCGALTFKDPASDQNNTAVPEAERSLSTEITGGFLLHDPTKGKDATTFNIMVKDLKPQVPSGNPPWTTIGWSGNYTTDGKTFFVRAIVDFSGTTAFEWGEYIDNPADVGVAGYSLYKGTTTGKFFEGPNGVVQLTIPPEAGGTAGAAFTGVYSVSTQGRTAPATWIPGVTRGLTQILDTAPDNGGTEGGGAKYTVAPCVAPPTPGGEPVVNPGTTTTTGSTEPGQTTTAPGGTSGGTSTTDAGSAALPIKVSAAKAPKGKSLTLKLRSSEAVTDIGARLRKGSKTLGTGKLAKLDGSGTLKLKLSKKVKKGSYVLDLAGNLVDGRRGLVSLKLKLK